MATKTKKTKAAATAPEPTAASLEKHEIAAPSKEYEFRGVEPDPGEGLPAPPVAPPAEALSAFDPTLRYEPTDITDHIQVFVDKANAYLLSDVAQHLTKAQYTDEFLPAFKKTL